MDQYRRVYASVNLDAITENIKTVRSRTPENTMIMAIIKADGYGHGAVPVAAAVDKYVDAYGTATIEEGIQLRKHGYEKPVLVLGVVHESFYSQLVEYDISPTIFQYERAEALSKEAVKMGKTAKLHLAVDTGMSRIGMSAEDSSVLEAERISRLPGIQIEGIFTHFATADEADKSGALNQERLFTGFIKKLEERGVFIPIKHSSNSAGILEQIGSELNMVRSGIITYGLYPSDEVKKEELPLIPAMGMKSFIAYIKWIEKGAAVSYGGTFVADRRMKIATIPVGYGDGYPRALSGRGEVLIRGKRAPILGRVCMDQFMVDVSHIEGVKEDDEVTLIGRDGAEEISVEEIAERSGGFHYEIICDVGKRVPRMYLKDGRTAGTKDYFDDIYQPFMKK